MTPLATCLAVVLPCACTVLLALMRILRAKSTMDQSDSDPMCLAYIYVSFVFCLLHSRLVNYISDIISSFFAKIEPDTKQTYGYFSWTATTICVLLEMATLIPFAYRALALFITAEPMIAAALHERFEVGAWMLSVCLLVLILVAPRNIPSRLLWVRFTTVYFIMLAAPAYTVWAAHYVASASEIMGKMLNPRSRAT